MTPRAVDDFLLSSLCHELKGEERVSLCQGLGELSLILDVNDLEEEREEEGIEEEKQKQKQVQGKEEEAKKCIVNDSEYPVESGEVAAQTNDSLDHQMSEEQQKSKERWFYKFAKTMIKCLLLLS